MQPWKESTFYANPKYLICPEGGFEVQPLGQFEVPVQKTGEVERYLPKDGKPYLRTLCLKILLGLLSRRNFTRPPHLQNCA